jgi:CDP-glucose 4,6-dehydratase
LFSNVYKNRRVFVTGHTGFKGSWLCQWLLKLGAEVHGYALDPQEHETLYDSLDLSNQIASDSRGEIRDLANLRTAIERAQPEIILHLAAQPLVRLSFDIPVDTFQINVLGTVNLLESIRTLDLPCSCVIVTTDKCYENREWLHSYREEDAMGGYDPYSASKGCAELVTSAYRRSYFQDVSKHRIASARAGNVIGGGDWAKDRIVPDIFRAIFAGKPVPVRNKHATRPWQHVLEPLSGYLWLAACLHERKLSSFPTESLTSGFNFGPSLSSNRTVAQIVEAILEQLDGTWVDQSDPNAPHEASKLNLAIDKALHMLEWMPTWDFAETIRQTVDWYRINKASGLAQPITNSQIDAYESSYMARRSNAIAPCAKTSAKTATV